MSVERRLANIRPPPGGKRRLSHFRNRRKRLRTKYALGDVFQSSTEKLEDSGLAYHLAMERAKKEGKGRKMPGGGGVGPLRVTVLPEEPA